MQLKVVLLPDPFGPIRPRISPSSTANETSWTARKAPNRFESPDTLSIGMGLDFRDPNAPASCPAQAGHPVNADGALTDGPAFAGSPAFAGDDGSARIYRA